MAHRRISRGVRLKPDNAPARKQLETTLKAAGDTAGAEAVASEVKTGDDFARQLDLGQSLLNKKDFLGAIGAYRKAIAIKPGDPRGHHYLALALNTKDDIDGAIAEFREAIRLKPEDAGVHDWLGYMLVRKGDHDAAMVELRKALRIDPNHLFAHRNLGGASWPRATRSAPSPSSAPPSGSSRMSPSPGSSLSRH